MIPVHYVGEIPELLAPGDYDTPEARRVLQVRIRRGPDGVEIVLDGPDADRLDAFVQELAEALGADHIEATLCG